MDDCASGTECSDQSARVMDEIECAVSTGGFSLKGFTVSGEDPLDQLSTDGISVTVLGLKWFPKGDFGPPTLVGAGPIRSPSLLLLVIISYY